MLTPDGLRGSLEAFAAFATAGLASLSLPWRVEVGAAALCPLAAFPEHGVSTDAETVAAVVTGLAGPWCGCALVALEPKPALQLIGGSGGPWTPGDAHAQLEAYLAAGSALAEAFGRAVLPGSASGSATLIEASLPEVLAATHAPRDAAVLSCELRFERGGQALSGWACLLVDGKLVPQLVEPRAAA